MSVWGCEWWNEGTWNKCQIQTKTQQYWDCEFRFIDNPGFILLKQEDRKVFLIPIREVKKIDLGLSSKQEKKAGELK